MWIVRSSVGAATKRPSATKAVGAHASVIAASSGASSARGSVVRIQAPVSGTSLWTPGAAPSAQRMS